MTRIRSPADTLSATKLMPISRHKRAYQEAFKLNSLRHFLHPQGFRFAPWAPIPLRLIVGIGFMQHGFAKLFKGPDAFAGILQALHVPMPHLMAWATILTEILGGLAVLLGAFVWLVSLPMTAVLLVAVFTVQLQYGFSSIKLLGVTPAGAQFGPPGYETNLLYIVCLAALVMAGPGPFAVDGLLRDSQRSSRPR